jgi:pyruvate kinase
MFFPKCTVFALTDNERAFGQMCLRFSLYPVKVDAPVNKMESIKEEIEKLKASGCINSGANVMIILPEDKNNFDIKVLKV